MQQHTKKKKPPFAGNQTGVVQKIMTRHKLLAGLEEKVYSGEFAVRPSLSPPLLPSLRSLQVRPPSVRKLNIVDVEFILEMSLYGLPVFDLFWLAE